MDAVREQGLDAVIVYPSGIMGPHDWAVGETTATLLQIIAGKMPVGISGSFNLVDVRDLAHGTIQAAEKGRRGEGYILSNEEISFEEFSRIISMESGCRPVEQFLPIPMAYALAKEMEEKAEKAGRKPVMTEFSVYNLARNNEFDCSKARRELGYVTRPYRETLKDQIRWLKAVGKIAA